MKTYLALILIIGISSVICDSNAKRSQKTSIKNLRSFFKKIRIYTDLINIIQKLVVTKKKPDKKVSVEDVFNIVYDDINPIHIDRKHESCKNIVELSEKLRKPTRIRKRNYFLEYLDA